MKLLHLGDLHLGKRLHGFDLLDDQRFILEQVLDLCDAHGVDAVALAGDLYDVSMPPTGAVLLLDWFLTALADRHIAVLAVAGNHDSADRLDYAAALLARQGVHLVGRFTGTVPSVVMQDDSGPVRFCLLPFVRAATVRHALPEVDIPDYTAALAAALATLPPREAGERRVLLAHQLFLAGGAPPECAGSENSAAALNIGTVDGVDAAVLDGFDYVALGHIHRPQQVGRPTVRYSGAPLCYSLDECGAAKSAVLVTLEQGEPGIELLPLTPRRALRHLTGTLAELTAAPKCPDDYIWATLTDETPVPEAMARLRAAYPNAMRLEYQPRGEELDLSTAAVAALHTQDFDELFARFFAQQHGRDLTEAERDALHAMRQEVSQ